MKLKNKESIILFLLNLVIWFVASICPTPHTTLKLDKCINFSKLERLIYLYECFVDILCACPVPVRPHALELWMVVYHHVGAQTEPRSSARAVNAFNF